MLSTRVVFALAAFLAGTAVALGAFGAHGLGERLEKLGYGDEIEKRLGWFETGVRYQMYHALTLLVLAAAAAKAGVGPSMVAVLGFALGTALFSGSLYGLTFVGPSFRWLGAITPLGGLSLLIAWAATALWGLRQL